VHEPRDLLGLAGGDLGDAHDHLDHVGDAHIRPNDAGLLRPLEQRVPCREERAAADVEERRVGLEVVQELGGEGALRRDVADEALEPAVEGLPRIAVLLEIRRRGRPPRPRRGRAPPAGPAGSGNCGRGLEPPTSASERSGRGAHWSASISSPRLSRLRSPRWLETSRGPRGQNPLGLQAIVAPHGG
jgi:hypothetical protein